MPSEVSSKKNVLHFNCACPPKSRLSTFLVLQLYEIGFSRYFRRRGFSRKAVYPITEIGHELGLRETELQKINPTHRIWRYLIETKKCPVLKVDLFKRFFIPTHDESWRNVIADTDYNERLIQEHQNFSEN